MAEADSFSNVDPIHQLMEELGSWFTLASMRVHVGPIAGSM
jgi:hypothetical protein